MTLVDHVAHDGRWGRWARRRLGCAGLCKRGRRGWLVSEQRARAWRLRVPEREGALPARWSGQRRLAAQQAAQRCTQLR